MAEQSSQDVRHSPFWLKLYAFTVMVLLPMDWFAPSGRLLREFGGKPVIPILTLGGLYGMTMLRHLRTSRRSAEFMAVVAFAAWLALGFGAAFLNFLMGWSGWEYLRDPLVQLVNQAMLVVVAGVAVIGNSRLARAYPLLDLAGRYLPAAVIIHLIVFGLEATGALSDSSMPLVLFRAATDPTRDTRPIGLFSEPAYFGTFAAIYGGALLCLVGSRAQRLFRGALAAILGIASVLIIAKTIVVVAGVQGLYFFLRRAKSIAMRVSAVLVLLIIGGCLLFFMQKYSVLDPEENLSSADRLGSTLLAANVAKEGYAVTGIGFGQFHFLYRKEFAPGFLLLSREARTQLTPQADQRASTYNFYLRVVVETGLAGFVILVLALRKLWFADVPPSATFTLLMFAGALGFLATQDTYFYPPLVFSSALILSALQAPRTVPVPSTLGTST